MKRGMFVAFGIFVALGVAFVLPAQALDWLNRPQYDAVAFHEGEKPGADNAACCPGCGDLSCAGTCGCPGWVGGAELLFMDPHSSAGNNFGGPGGPYTEWGYRPAWRFWLGYQVASGQGIRVRYFEFDQNQDYFDPQQPENAGVTALSLDYDAWYIDVEYFDTIHLGGQWTALLHGGIRHAELARTDEMTYDFEYFSFNRYLTSSWGLTGGLELRRPLICKLQMYSNLQGAILFGDSDSYTPQGQIDNHLENGSQAMFELAFGVERTFDLASGAQLFGRVGVEAQYWNDFAREVDFAQGESFGLFGYTFAVGLTR